MELNWAIGNFIKETNINNLNIITAGNVPPNPSELLASKRFKELLEKLKKEVCDANLLLPKYGLVTFTWGNVSAVDRERGVIVIKPSGVEYDELTPDMVVVVDLNGNIVEGELNPSSDTPTHIELYKSFKDIGGVVHTHSQNAVSFAQAKRSITIYGTTHADYFFGDIPCTRELTREEVESDYEKNTGLVISEKFKYMDAMSMPAVLVANHGPFTWGKDAKDAVHNAVVLEQVALMAMQTELLNPNITAVNDYIKDKHYYRKHGADAYYGQKK